MALDLQMNIERGIFAIVDPNTTVVGCGLLDSTIFYRVTSYQLLISDSGKNIADYCKLSLSYSAISLHLIPSLPYFPFQSIPLWEGLKIVQPFCIMNIENRNKIVEKRIWYPQAYSDDISSAISFIRKKLIEICSLNKMPSINFNLSSDLSGGIDSATIAYILKKNNLDTKLFHIFSNSKFNTDTVWAKKIVNDLEVPLNLFSSSSFLKRRFSINKKYFDNQFSDFPILWAETEGYIEKICKYKSHYDKSIHFLGIGGDELFTPMPAYAWSIVNHRHHKSIWFILRYAMYSKRSFIKNIFNLLKHNDYTSELRLKLDQAFGITNKKRKNHDLEWTGEISVPGWLDRRVLSSSYELAIKVINSSCVNLDEDRSKHQSLESILFQKRVLSQINLLYGNDNFKFISPFLDSHIVESALTVPVNFHINKGITKPILQKVTNGIVPIDVFTRGFKGDYSNELYQGYELSSKDMMRDINSLKLVEMGIVDPDKLLVELSMPTALHGRIENFERLVCVERWIRTLM